MKYKELKSRVRTYQEMLGVANATIHRQMQHIEQLNKQLDIQDIYLVRKDEENNVLKRMYRDDIINNYKEHKE